MPYIDSDGNIQDKAPWYHLVWTTLQTWTYAISLFLYSLFNVSRSESVNCVETCVSSQILALNKRTSNVGPAPANVSGEAAAVRQPARRAKAATT